MTNFPLTLAPASGAREHSLSRLGGRGAPERGAGTRLRDATVKAHNSTRISGALHPAAGSHPSASRWNLFRPPRARGEGGASANGYQALLRTSIRRFSFHAATAAIDL